MSWDTLYMQLARDLCKENFSDFVKEFWSEVVPEQLHWNWHMQVICDECQEITERIMRGDNKEYDLILNVPPGMSKSSLCTVMLPTWCWAKKPSMRTICCSYSHTLSLALSIRSRDLIKSDKYMSFFPEIRIREDQDQKAYYKNIHGGERFTTSAPSGTVTGMHAHLIVVDDPVNPNEANSDVMLHQANRFLTDSLFNRRVDASVTSFILIQQRLHEEDSTGFLLERKDKIRHICLPAEDCEFVKPPELRERYINGLLDPKRLPKTALDDLKEDLGDYGYAGQYLQNPYPLEGSMFNPDKIEIVPVPPRRIFSTIRYWDKAATAGGGAYTVGCKMAKLVDGRFIILDIIRGRWAPDQRERIIRQTAQIDGIEVRIYMEQEPGSSGSESVQNSIRALGGFSAYADCVRGDKVLRADPYAVQMNSGNVMMLKAEWNKDYINEIRNFPLGKYKDQVDASSGAFAMLTKAKKVGTWAKSH